MDWKCSILFNLISISLNRDFDCNFWIQQYRIFSIVSTGICRNGLYYAPPISITKTAECHPWWSYNAKNQTHMCTQIRRTEWFQGCTYYVLCYRKDAVWNMNSICPHQNPQSRVQSLFCITLQHSGPLLTLKNSKVLLDIFQNKLIMVLIKKFRKIQEKRNGYRLSKYSPMAVCNKHLILGSNDTLNMQNLWLCF